MPILIWNRILNKMCIRDSLKGSGLTYTVHDGVIAIKPASKVEEMAAPQQKTKLNVTVVDETGEAIIGANVIAVSYTHLQHSCQVTMTDTNLTVVGYRTRDTESLQTDTDSFGSVSSILAAFLGGRHEKGGV